MLKNGNFCATCMYCPFDASSSICSGSLQKLQCVNLKTSKTIHYGQSVKTYNCTKIIAFTVSFLRLLTEFGQQNSNLYTNCLLLKMTFIANLYTSEFIQTMTTTPTQNKIVFSIHRLILIVLKDNERSASITAEDNGC